MKFTNHAKWSAVAALALTPLLRKQALTFWAAAVFVDLDHLPGMIRRCGLNPVALTRFALTFRFPPGSNPPGMRMARSLHHPLLPIALLAMRGKSPLATPLAMGLAFHYLLDYYDHANGNALSDAATDRAGYLCQECGRYEGRLQAHAVTGFCPPQHTVPLDTLVALCDRCHAQAHVG